MRYPGRIARLDDGIPGGGEPASLFGIALAQACGAPGAAAQWGLVA